MREIKSCISCISSFKVLLVPTIELCASRLTEKVCTYVSLRVVTSGRTRISTTTATISDESRKQSNCLYCKHSVKSIEFNVRKTYDIKQHTSTLLWRTVIFDKIWSRRYGFALRKIEWTQSTNRQTLRRCYLPQLNAHYHKLLLFAKREINVNVHVYASFRQKICLKFKHVCKN